MWRYLIDAGRPIGALIEILVDRHRRGRWPAEWPAVSGELLSASATA